MKLWHGYGSEHSMNLVMIGRFKDVNDAAEAKQIIERLTAQVRAEVDEGRMELGEPTERYSDEMSGLLRDLNLYGIDTSELQQFTYDVSTEGREDQVVVTTDESDVSAYLKVLIDKGARVEVYSAHFYPGTGHGRGG